MTSYEASKQIRSEQPARSSRIIKTKTTRKEKQKEVETPEGTYIKHVSTERVERIEKISAAPHHRPVRIAGPRVVGQPSSVGSGESQQQLPLRWKLSLRGVRSKGKSDGESLNGDYVLDLLYAEDCAARWEHVFPAQAGLFRASLDMIVDGKQIHLRASLSGLCDGPAWTTCFQLPFREVTLRLENPVPEAGSGLIWPDCVILCPIGQTADQLAAESFKQGGSGDWVTCLSLADESTGSGC